VAISAGPAAIPAGLWAVILGGVLLLGIAFERTRYRSEAAERQSASPGPGGGEAADAPLEPRFRRTDEIFIDPTTSLRMRVYLDSSTGERRYRSEG
jgi:hypothetical protein